MDSQTFFTIILPIFITCAVAFGIYAMSISLIEPRLARWSAFFAWVPAIILFIWYGGTNDMSRIWRYSIAGGLAALVTVILSMAIDYIGNREKQLVAVAIQAQSFTPGMLPSTTQVDEVLPGFAWWTVFNMSALAEISRQYVFEYRTPEGARVAFFLSASNRFTFSVTDRNGEPYSIEVPLGKDGIPIGRSIFLYCSVGSGSNYAFMRVYINGKEIASRDFLFPIDMGSRQWIDGTIGANLGHGNGSSFSMQETMVAPLTLSGADLQTLTDNSMNYYNITNAPVLPPSTSVPQ